MDVTRQTLNASCLPPHKVKILAEWKALLFVTAAKVEQFATSYVEETLFMILNNEPPSKL